MKNVSLFPLRMRRLGVALSAAACLGLWLVVPQGWAEEIEFDEAEIFLELNDTDGDLGLQAILDAPAWAWVRVRDPSGRAIGVIATKGRLQQQGLTQIEWESSEPNFEEQPAEEFLERFPPGEYVFEGRTLDSEDLRSSTELSHVLPAAPDGITVAGEEVPEECDEDADVLGPVVDHPVVIEWEPVTTSHPELGEAGDVEIVQYQVVVETEDPQLVVFSADLLPSETSVTVPEEFLDQAEDEFKFEVIARGDTHNQSITESCFQLE